MWRRVAPVATLGIVVALAGSPASAQPWDQYFGSTSNPANGWIEVPNHAELNPASAITIEAWVYLFDDNPSCKSLVGKNYVVSWWVGTCADADGNLMFRSYVNGLVFTSGIVRKNLWEHFAVVYDGAHRYHYINGELVGAMTQTGAINSSTDPIRILSDVRWPYTPQGRIEDLRIWNVARTVASIRSDLNEIIAPDSPGLVANWRFNANADDATGRHHGVLAGTDTGYWYYGTSTCPATSTEICIFERFKLSVEWRDLAGDYHDGMRAAPSSPASGLMYFITPDNWELLLKMHNACVAPFNHYWLFVSGSTSLFYRLEVVDEHTAARRIYFSYGGTAPPAIIDTEAFATCP